MKPVTVDGTSSWIDYKSHFDMCGDINGWSYEQKGLYLDVSLRRMALGVLGNLLENDKKNFISISLALSKRFSPKRQTELYRPDLKKENGSMEIMLRSLVKEYYD